MARGHWGGKIIPSDEGDVECSRRCKVVRRAPNSQEGNEQSGKAPSGLEGVKCLKRCQEGDNCAAFDFCPAYIFAI